MIELTSRNAGAPARIGRRNRRSRRAAPSSGGNLGLGISILAISAALFWLVSIYASGLRDPRYLDGWLLAGGMCLQSAFHIAVKTVRLSPKSFRRWRKAHIAIGYLLIAVFVSHSDLSLPDTGLEWALWSGFVLITASGMFGLYLAWSLEAKRGIEETAGDEQKRRAELRQALELVVAIEDPSATASFLPAPPYQAWIADLYTGRLKSYFEDETHVVAHLIGSERPLKRLKAEIDDLSRFVDRHGQEKLEIIKALVVEKDKLDFARVHRGLAAGWLLVHVPVAYGLVALSLIHVLVVYAFSSGAW